MFGQAVRGVSAGARVFEVKTYVWHIAGFTLYSYRYGLYI